MEAGKGGLDLRWDLGREGFSGRRSVGIVSRVFGMVRRGFLREGEKKGV